MSAAYLVGSELRTPLPDSSVSRVLDCGMPKRKASKARKEASKKAHEARGSGSKSRISLDFEKLKNAGWTIEERPKSYSGKSLQFSYRNPEGKSLKSAEEVKRQLHAEGILEEFVTENRNQVQELRFRRSNDLPSSDETDDSDYEPPMEKQTLKEIKHDKG